MITPGEFTLNEKASLSIGADFWHTIGVARLGLPAILLSDGPHGLRTPTTGSSGGGLGGTRPATCFPTASALGSSWDPDLVRSVGAAIGAEAPASRSASVPASTSSGRRCAAATSSTSPRTPT